ncbi:MAG: CrcB family protein [Bacteroidales bacterium]|nr:CrcB family protein [Candidatus Cryptobacteroides onthequi]
MIRNFMMVGCGGAVGAMLRYGATLACTAAGSTSELATFIINAAGSLLMGLLIGSCGQSPWLLMLTTGLCGGFTTYSTFSVQSVTLMQQGRWGSAALYVLGTVIVCLLSAAAGLWLGQRLSH